MSSRHLKEFVPSESAIRRALRRAQDGVALDPVEAETLLHARGDQLDQLFAAASRVRDAGLAAAGRPGVITFSRSVFVPLTKLCRDRCHYCTFATVPGRVPAPFLNEDEVLDVVRRGAELGCTEVLFTLGDRPEDRWSAAREWLDEAGYSDTLSYVRAMSIKVLEETGVLPHLNPGVLTWQDFQRLKPVSASMGMMLETTATRLWAEPGGPHYGSPDKEPAVRLRVLEDAGRSNVPFTTGILLGIGETLAERVDSLFAIRKVARQYGGIQEVIVQNFRAKPDTAMRRMPDLEAEELAATVAVARLVLGPKMRIQAPPNLIAGEYELLLRAGIDDWGGVSPLTLDHVNPERPWPQEETLAEHTAAAGFTLAERLPIYPEYVLRGEPWLDPRIAGHVTALADPATGLAAPGSLPAGRPWQEPEVALVSSGRTDLHDSIDTEGRASDRREDFDSVYGDWEVLRSQVAPIPSRTSSMPGGGLRRKFSAALSAAEANPGNLSDEDSLMLLSANDGPEISALASLADDVRQDAVGDDVTYVVTRNINFTNVCYTGCRFCAFAQRRTDSDAYTLSLEQVGQRAVQAWEVGATEVCMQGGIHPDLPGTAYFDIAAEVKKHAPGLHVHAFSPMEVVNGASRTNLSIREWLAAAREAGVDSMPGTAAEILDDDVRWVLTKGKLPTASWIEVVTTARELDIPTTSTMMYGHVDKPSHWVAHIKLIRDLQAQTGGFTEFVLLPFVHTNAPLYLAGIARPGPTHLENRAVHALARLLLHGRINNIQTSWVKLGDPGVIDVLRGGANDLGGTLMEETISRMAGSDNGSYKTIADLEALAHAAGRPARQRTTTYGEVLAERIATGRAHDGVWRPHLLPLASGEPALTRTPNR
ncbi:bifunctional FO biosynthesis protein CofGH [Saccharopolyspora spinosa]|uniref:FO synthase n=1 Tax=Saccharopolyspora spinosa TaxID=60894 RepID=A0A2N3Y1M0_SACSN|nr:bifunctional FO biosynthesis protein CofGH [Saccharopolyspora spinosa]PKW16826.1 FO synthase subunit 1 /FO synthase subunit 2 [Saccharopolyspora spinosa]